MSQPSLGVEHELTTNTMGEIDTETPPMRAIPVHQRSPGGMHGQMETHWEENNSPACRYFNKHYTRSVNLELHTPIVLEIIVYNSRGSSIAARDYAIKK